MADTKDRRDANDRRKTDRRKTNAGPPKGTSERRRVERRSGRDRREKPGSR